MQRMRSELEPGYVIHRRRYRESSLLIEMLTAEHGRIGLVARGARRARSPLRALLQPFQPLLVSWTARGELGTLTGAEPARAAPPLAGERLYSGFYLNELTYRLLERDDPHVGFFQIYERALDQVRVPRVPGDDDEGLQAGLRIFEKRLLETIGYGLVLDRAVDTGASIEPDGIYRYEHQRGPALAARAAGGGVRESAGAYGEVVVSGATLRGLAEERLSGRNELAEAKLLMRSMLAPYLGIKPLSSRRMFRSV